MDNDKGLRREYIEQGGRMLIPDENPNFNPERNRQIIQSVANNNWENRKKKMKEARSKVDERADAIATFLTSDKRPSGAITPKVIERYFGKNNLAYLRGDLDEDRRTDPLIVRDSKGRVIRKPD